MGGLGIENSITMDPVLPYQGTSILTEIMKNFNNISIFQNLLQGMRCLSFERINL